MEAAVTLVVPRFPEVEALYFWALQVSFPGGGGAHLGLQWGADPGRRLRHVNFGGYGRDGELAGTDSERPSSFGNPNTRDFDWEEGVPYRLRIARGGRGWAGWVDDLAVRELLAPDGPLTGPMVWSEVFADCGDPPVSVRWSDPELVDRSGRRGAVGAATVSYQARGDGGCDNTSSTVEGRSFVQTTSTARRTPHRARLRLP